MTRSRSGRQRVYRCPPSTRSTPAARGRRARPSSAAGRGATTTALRRFVAVTTAACAPCRRTVRKRRLRAARSLRLPFALSGGWIIRSHTSLLPGPAVRGLHPVAGARADLSRRTGAGRGPGYVREYRRRRRRILVLGMVRDSGSPRAGGRRVRPGGARRQRARVLPAGVRVLLRRVPSAVRQAGGPAPI